MGTALGQVLINRVPIEETSGWALIGLSLLLLSGIGLFSQVVPLTLLNSIWPTTLPPAHRYLPPKSQKTMLARTAPASIERGTETASVRTM